MKKTTGIIACAGILIALSALSYYALKRNPAITAAGTTTPSTGDITVTLTEQGYSPDVLTIKVGTTVHFKTKLTTPHWPASNPHPQHSIYTQFDPREPVARDKEWSFKFDRTGHYGFHDHIRSYYTGSVDVVQ
jgi:plastocyanin